jgi:hypothetical protein
MLRARSIFYSVFAAQLMAGAVMAHAEEKSISPYIDQLKAKMDQEGKAPSQPVRTSENPDPYIQSQREKMKTSGKEAAYPSGTQPYIDHLKSKDPALNEPIEGKDYSAEAKARLAPEESGGAIQALHEGRSDLHLKRPGHISGGIGLKMAASMNHGFSGDPQYVANQFSTIYGNNWVPDFTLMAEYKPFYSEIFGSLGFIGTAGVSIYKANGRFATQLKQPNGSDFPLESRTKLTFLSVPVMIGAKYQFNLGHIIRPYAIVGPTLIGVSENRNDGIGAKKALSKGLTTTAGAAFLLDWINASNSWNLYQDFSIKHYYLTVEYTKLTTLSSPIEVSYSGLSAGFAFDF